MSIETAAPAADIWLALLACPLGSNAALLQRGSAGAKVGCSRRCPADARGSAAENNNSDELSKKLRYLTQEIEVFNQIFDLKQMEPLWYGHNCSVAPRGTAG